MKLTRFMNDAYQGKKGGHRLKTRQEDIVFSLEDLADRVGIRPVRASVEEFAPSDEFLLGQLIAPEPVRKYQILWGYLSSIAAERSSVPMHLPSRDYAGLELSRGIICLDEAKDHVGERMKGGRIFACGSAGDYLGQEMSGGGIIAHGCGDYAFRNMRGGFGVIKGNAGKFFCLGNCGGRVILRGSCNERAGWLMHSGSIRIRKDAGDYLGLLMSGGKIVVKGGAGKRAGWRKKGGTIIAGSHGPEAADDLLGLD
jgi:formylmethanofuran dehydrogenase subunit C